MNYLLLSIQYFIFYVPTYSRGCSVNGLTLASSQTCRLTDELNTDVSRLKICSWQLVDNAILIRFDRETRFDKLHEI